MLSITSPRHTSTLPIRDIASTSQLRKWLSLPKGAQNESNRPFAALQDRPYCRDGKREKAVFGGRRRFLYDASTRSRKGQTLESPGFAPSVEIFEIGRGTGRIAYIQPCRGPQRLSRTRTKEACAFWHSLWPAGLTFNTGLMGDPETHRDAARADRSGSPMAAAAGEQLIESIRMDRPSGDWGHGLIPASASMAIASVRRRSRQGVRQSECSHPWRAPTPSGSRLLDGVSVRPHQAQRLGSVFG
jgi:hypothetical protein